MYEVAKEKKIMTECYDKLHLCDRTNTLHSIIIDDMTVAAMCVL